MPATLRLMDAALLPAWIERSAGEYARDLVALGAAEDQALADAVAGMHESFPEGNPQDGHAVFDVVDDGSTVGYLWIGPDSSGDPLSWWIWDVLIDGSRRGSGLGRAAMRLAEDYARSEGATTIGLNVFAFNAPAQRLYQSLGYETVSSRMRKRLDG